VHPYDLSDLSDDAVDRELTASVAAERSSTAAVLARLGEYDARKLYLRASYPSLYEYCVVRLHLSEGAARKRIHAARAARQFPALFAALADGRLHLTGIVTLAPHLTPDNVKELVAACAHRSAAQIEQVLGERVLRLETLREDNPEPAPIPVAVLAPTEPASIDPQRTARCVASNTNLEPPPSARSTAASVASALALRPSVWIALEAGANDKLEYARALLSQRMPLGSASTILEYALDEIIAQEEKRKFAATEKPKSAHRRSRRARHIPAQVKRTVWRRDRGQCTFVSESGKRCESRQFLEFDHVTSVARGGRATVEGMRLRCRGHNQYEAERTFGAGFMQRKREQARAASKRESGMVAERSPQADRAKPG
jgi:hypothetical protein